MKLLSGVVATIISMYVASIYYIPGLDLTSEWLSVTAALDGVNPYQPVGALAEIYGAGQELKLVHPRTPGALLLLAPLALFTPETLWFVGVVGLVLVLALAAWLLWGTAGVVALPLLLVTFPGWDMAKHGHVSFALLALCGVVAIRYLDERPKVAGVSVAVAAVLKLFPGLWMLALLATGRRVAFRWSVGVFTTLNVVGLALPGIRPGQVIGGIFDVADAETGNVNGSLIGFGVPVWVVVMLAAAFLFLWPRRSLVRASLPVSVLLSPLAWLPYTLLVFPALSRRFAVMMLAFLLSVRIFAEPWFEFDRQTLVVLLLGLLLMALDPANLPPWEHRKAVSR